MRRVVVLLVVAAVTAVVAVMSGLGAGTAFAQDNTFTCTNGQTNVPARMQHQVEELGYTCTKNLPFG